MAKGSELVSSSTTNEAPSPTGRLTMKQAAARIPCSDRHLYDLAYEGVIPSYIAAGKRWVDEADIEVYLARCKLAGPQFKRGSGKRAVGRPRKHATPVAAE
jgi:hypothetical protein